MTGHRSEQPPLEFEISWRTEELGPEARRRLFEKVLPSHRPARVRDAAVADTSEAGHSERPRSAKEVL